MAKVPNPAPHVAKAFEDFPQQVQPTLLRARSMIFSVADSDPKIGTIEETLKWNEPAYLTPQTKSGSTIRLALHKATERPALFVHCSTDLIARFRQHYDARFNYEGKRALLLPDLTADVAEDDEQALRHCIAMALLYHTLK